MIEPATHAGCIRCGNTNLNERIFQCRSGHIFCQRCGEGIYGGWKCPECEEMLFDEDKIGWIGPPTDPPRDLKEWSDVRRQPVCRRCLCNRRETRIYQCYDKHEFCDVCKKKLPWGDHTECGYPDCGNRAPKSWRETGAIIP